MAAPNTDVLIVGAGPTGLLLALELAAQGLAVRIIDKAPEPSIKSKALVVQIRTLEIFEQLGVIAEALKRGKKLQGLSISTGSHKALEVRFEEIKSPYPFPLILEQSQTEAILNDKLNSFNCQVEREMELVGLKQDSNRVTATFKSRDGSTHEIKSQWLVGCDGAHSAVRHFLGFNFAGKSYPQQFILGDVGMTWPLPPDKLYIYVSPRGFMAVAPLPEPQLFRLITTESALYLDADPTIPELQKMVDELIPFKTTVSPGPWTARFKVSCRKVRRFSSGRVFLAGDAAHVHSPAGGLGMNTGLQDSYNLAWKLALVVKGQAASRLLESYTSEREPIAASLLKTTDRLFFLIGGGVMHPLLKFFQAHLVPLVFGFAPIRRKLLHIISQLGINYRKSNIVIAGARQNKGLIRLGYRLPDLDIPSGENKAPQARRLWELLRARRHHVIIFGDAPLEANLQTSIPYETHQLPARLNDGLAQTVIVRPDGYVGAIFPGMDAKKIAAYFQLLANP